MRPEELETLLRAWGLYYREDKRRPPRGDRTIEHTLARVMETAEFKPGRHVKRASRKLVGRDGYARRLIMGAAAGLQTAEGRPLPIPMTYCDPVPCPRGSGGGGSSGSSGAPTRPVPAPLQRVQAGAKALDEISLLRGLCLRAQYCVEGDQAEKADWVTEEFQKASPHADPIKVGRFRDELAFGRVWIGAWLVRDTETRAA